MTIRFGRKSGVYYQFSNFYGSKLIFQGIEYRNSEAAFQAMKSLNEDVRKEFSCLTGGQAKKKGRQVLLRPDWERVKFDIMCDILYDKFTQNSELKNLLLSTNYDLLIEDTTAWHDNNWGCCSCYKCKSKVSKNMLGMALMKVRSKISGNPFVAKFMLMDKEYTLDFESEEYLHIIETAEGKTMMSNIFKYSK